MEGFRSEQRGQFGVERPDAFGHKMKRIDPKTGRYVKRGGKPETGSRKSGRLRHRSGKKPTKPLPNLEEQIGLASAKHTDQTSALLDTVRAKTGLDPRRGSGVPTHLIDASAAGRTTGGGAPGRLIRDPEVQGLYSHGLGAEGKGRSIIIKRGTEDLEGVAIEEILHGTDYASGRRLGSMKGMVDWPASAMSGTPHNQIRNIMKGKIEKLLDVYHPELDPTRRAQFLEYFSQPSETFAKTVRAYHTKPSKLKNAIGADSFSQIEELITQTTSIAQKKGFNRGGSVRGYNKGGSVRGAGQEDLRLRPDGGEVPDPKRVRKPTDYFENWMRRGHYRSTRPQYKGMGVGEAPRTEEQRKARREQYLFLNPLAKETPFDFLLPQNTSSPSRSKLIRRGGVSDNPDAMNELIKREQSDGGLLLFGMPSLADQMDGLEQGQRWSGKRRHRRGNWLGESPKSGMNRRPIIRDGVQYHKNGGSVGGYNKGGNVDSVPAMLTPGEFVMRKQSVDKYGQKFMNDINLSKVQLANGGGMMGMGGSKKSVSGTSRVGGASQDLEKSCKTGNRQYCCGIHEGLRDGQAGDSGCPFCRKYRPATRQCSGPVSQGELVCNLHRNEGQHGR